MSVPKETEKQDEDSGITMVDVLQEEEELEDDAEAVLGSGDDSNCSYGQGYLKRQPLYACLTCCPPSSGSPGGVCLGCSYHCHEGHSLVELYTKRNFRCDCGNSKFPEDNQCKLQKEKDQTNSKNKYNQNFLGKYCTCARPYPDPEDSIDDQMIQCIICEDWFHSRHLEGGKAPLDEGFSEMICHLCVSNVSFIKYYLGYSVITRVKDEDTKEDLDISSTSQKSENESQIVSDASDSQNSDSCLIKSKIEDLKDATGAIFLADKWRNGLCRCSACKEMYFELNVAFLLDMEDTVSHYEQEGRTKRMTKKGVQREIDALSSLDRFTRTEVVHEFNNFSSSLREYLKKFAENGKTVRKEDINEFFSQLSAKKKQKTSAGVQYFCK